MLRKFLNNNLVDTQRVGRSLEVSTGLAAIFVNRSGENLIVVDQGANALVDPEYFTVDLPSAGYYLAQLETPAPAVRAFFVAGQAKGIRRALNAAPANPAAKTLFRLCDLIIINEPESSTYAGSMLAAANLGEIGTAAKMLLSHDDQTIIVTCGKQGAVAVGHGTNLVIEAHAAEAVDTTAAGDCYLRDACYGAGSCHQPR